MRTKKGIRPVAILPLGFLGLILVGTVLLSLPAATVDRTSIGVFDAWFTATSASCITGLIVTDTAGDIFNVRPGCHNHAYSVRRPWIHDNGHAAVFIGKKAHIP